MGTTRLVDGELSPIKYSNKKSIKKAKKITFGSSLIESIAPGCTYVFNNALVQIIKDKKPQEFFMHDWILHKIAKGLGKVIFDSTPYISYRQHGNNVIGGTATSTKRAKNILQKDGLSTRMQDALCLERYFTELLSKENNQILNQLINYKSTFKARRQLAFNKKIKPTNFVDRAFFRYLVLRGKI